MRELDEWMPRCEAGDPCVFACLETAGLLLSFEAMGGSGAVGIMPGIFCA